VWKRGRSILRGVGRSGGNWESEEIKSCAAKAARAKGKAFQSDAGIANEKGSWRSVKDTKSLLYKRLVAQQGGFRYPYVRRGWRRKNHRSQGLVPQKKRGKRLKKRGSRGVCDEEKHEIKVSRSETRYPVPNTRTGHPPKLINRRNPLGGRRLGASGSERRLNSGGKKGAKEGELLAGSETKIKGNAGVV